MAGERNYLRVPPDSTGKRVHMKHSAQVYYKAKNTTNPGYVWTTDDSYTIVGLGIVHVHGVVELTNDTGILEVHYNKSATYNGVNPTIDAFITDADGITNVAKVSAFNDVYINTQNIVGYDNPENGLDIDATGSANIRFAEGLPQLDAFGKLRVSGKTLLGDYIFNNGILNQDFSSLKYGIAVGTSVSHSDDAHCLILSTPAVTSTGIGNHQQIYAEHTSNTYHHYFPGISHLAIMTVALSDSGEPGVMREWGYFDDDNGYFFRANEEQTSVGGDNLELVIRSSATGLLRETRMGRNYTSEYLWNTGTLSWDQTSFNTDGWNKDTLDGFGDSGKQINLVDDNIWWVDIQWLGAGRCRFGTYHKGQRVIIHEYYHDTNGGLPHSQTGALPVSFRQYNILNATVTNPTSMKVWCCAVATEADIQLKGIGRGSLTSFEVGFDPTNLNDWKGTNDIGKGERVGITTTNVSGSTTTLTVPSTTIVGPGQTIRVGYRLHLEASNGGGTLQMDTKVLEIVNDTTIIVDKAPATPLTGIEDIRFHLHVDEEYNFIGILSPRKIVPGHAGINRTLYIPQAMRTMAYHENGDPAFLEIELYVNPVLSGNATVINDPSVLTIVEKDISTSATVRNENNGLVNYFGGGYHNLITFLKGQTGREDLGSQYTNFQQGAFKNYAARGGNNRCPIKRVIQSPAAGIPTVIEIDTATVFANGGPSFSLHREGNAIELVQIPGVIGSDATNGINNGVVSGAGKSYYLRMISQSHAELWEDSQYTVPTDTSAISNTTNGNSYTWPGNTGSIPTGGFIESEYGEELYFGIVAKPVGPSAAGKSYGSTTSTIDANRDITVHFSLNWNEVEQ